MAVTRRRVAATFAVIIGCAINLADRAYAQAKEALERPVLVPEIGRDPTLGRMPRFRQMPAIPSTGRPAPPPRPITLGPGIGFHPKGQTVPEVDYVSMRPMQSVNEPGYGTGLIPKPPEILQVVPSTAEQCGSAEAKLREVESRLGRRLAEPVDELALPARFVEIWQPLDDDKRRQLDEYGNAVNAYVTSCLAPYESVRDDVKRWGLDRISGVLEVQSVGGWTVFCGAFRLSRTRIATARHCFYGLFSQPDTPFREAMRQGHVAFQMPLLPAARRYTVTGETCTTVVADDRCKALRTAIARGYVSLQDDYLVLEVADTGDVALPELVIAAPQRTPHYVAMLAWTKYPHFARLAEYALGKRRVKDTSVSLLMPRQGSCLVRRANAVCVLNGCQTSAGTSGTPLFAVTSNGPALIGIHVSTPEGVQDEYGIGLYCDVKAVTTPYGAVLGNVARSAGEFLREFQK